MIRRCLSGRVRHLRKCRRVRRILEIAKIEPGFLERAPAGRPQLPFPHPRSRECLAARPYFGSRRAVPLPGFRRRFVGTADQQHSHSAVSGFSRNRIMSAVGFGPVCQ